MSSFTDTIVAISTPPGVSGIGIVRLTGPDALSLVSRLFSPADPRKVLFAQATYTLVYGRVVDGEEVVDEALVSVMRGPRSYTTQDVVEINCHGGIVPLRRTLELCLREGARLADPGEFTLRAFYFGRIDLAQAEAAADLINAQTAEAAQAAVQQLAGRLSGKVEALRTCLASLLAHLEAQIDFGEDDIDRLSPGETRARLRSVRAHVDELLATAEQGKLLRQGARVALVGRPNVGKSSLMNALLGEERMIVTPIPGTTRDTVAESINIHGVPVVLVDTAGLREVADEVEQAGVDRARAALEEADVVLLVVEEPVETWNAEGGTWNLGGAEERVMVVVNKCDLRETLIPDQGSWARGVGVPWVEVSAKTHEGLEGLREAIAQRIGAAGVRGSAEVIVTNVRHQRALLRTREAVERALAGVEAGTTEEYLAEDLRTALEALGEITGATSREEIIAEIFARFCVGK
jgi:tRNA modification GTPase